MPQLSRHRFDHDRKPCLGKISEAAELVEKALAQTREEIGKFPEKAMK